MIKNALTTVYLEYWYFIYIIFFIGMTIMKHNIAKTGCASFTLNFLLWQTKLWFIPAFSPGRRSPSMRTETSRVAPMSATPTALTCTPTSAAATPSRWKAAAGCCMRSPITPASSMFWPEESTQTTSVGWATMTPYAPAARTLMWVNVLLHLMLGKCVN